MWIETFEGGLANTDQLTRIDAIQRETLDDEPEEWDVRADLFDEHCSGILLHRCGSRSEALGWLDGLRRLLGGRKRNDPA